MELILQIHQALLLRSVERPLKPQDRARKERSDLSDVLGNVKDLQLVFGHVGEGVRRGLLEVEENAKGESESFDAKQIVSNPSTKKEHSRSVLKREVNSAKERKGRSYGDDDAI